MTLDDPMRAPLRRLERLQQQRRRRTQRRRRALSGAVTVLLLGVLLGVVFVGYGLLDNRWYKVLAVDGGSMAPTIMPGDLIVITRPPARLQTGDVVTMEVEGRVVTHRVVAVETGGALTTRGDANEVTDDWHSPVRVVGICRFRIPALGSLVRRSGAYFADAKRVGVGLQAPAGTGTTAFFVPAGDTSVPMGALPSDQPRPDATTSDSPPSSDPPAPPGSTVPGAASAEPASPAPTPTETTVSEPAPTEPNADPPFGVPSTTETVPAPTSSGETSSGPGGG